MPADIPRVAGQDRVREALQPDVDLDADEWLMAETDELLFTRDFEEAIRWAFIGHDVRRVRIHIADALLSRPAPEPPDE